MIFVDRADAARRLAEVLKDREFHRPLVLGIPRGGAVTAAVLADALGADFNIVLARKLRAPGRPELAIGAISEKGEAYLNSYGQAISKSDHEYVAQEIRWQLAEIERRQSLFRSIRPAVPLAARTVIVTDDGIATGSTMIAALQTARLQNPAELVVAVPVAPADRLGEVGRWCDEVVCLQMPEDFWAIGQFYEDFRPVEDWQVVDLLRKQAAVQPSGAAK